MFKIHPLALTLGLSLVFAPALIAAPGLDRAVADPAPKPAEHHACFYSRNVNGFNAPDDQTLYLRVGIHDIYRATLFGSCPGIQFKERLAMRSQESDWICEGSGPVDLEFLDREPGGPQRCQVSDLHKLTADEIAALPKKSRP